MKKTDEWPKTVDIDARFVDSYGLRERILRMTFRGKKLTLQIMNPKDRRLGGMKTIARAVVPVGKFRNAMKEIGA